MYLKHPLGWMIGEEAREEGALIDATDMGAPCCSVSLGDHGETSVSESASCN